MRMSRAGQMGVGKGCDAGGCTFRDSFWTPRSASASRAAVGHGAREYFFPLGLGLTISPPKKTWYVRRRKNSGVCHRFSAFFIIFRGAKKEIWGPAGKRGRASSADQLACGRDLNLLINYALNIGTSRHSGSSSQEAVVQLESVAHLGRRLCPPVHIPYLYAFTL